MAYSDGLYLEINLISLLIVGRIYLQVILDVNKPYRNKLFARVCFWCLVFFFGDAGYILVSYLFPHGIAVNYVMNIIYFCASGLFGFAWFQYSTHILDMDIFSKKNIHILSLIPLIILLIATLSSPWTHLIFYIDEANKYHRGVLHTLQVICMNIYCIIPCFIAFIKSRNKNDIANLNKYSSLCFFILWELAAQTFQIFNLGYPAMSAGISMAMLSCHLRMKDASVSLDPLTQINNRNQLLNHMAYRLKSLPMYIQEDSEKKLYLMIMDANLFKQINDNYGHIEGDEALKLIATALKKTVVVTGGFICRYGGDEFMLITEKKNDAEMDDVKVMFNDNLKTVVEQANKPYPLTASSGYARLTETITTFDALVEAADAIMYEEKQKNRQAR